MHRISMQRTGLQNGGQDRTGDGIRDETRDRTGDKPGDGMGPGWLDKIKRKEKMMTISVFSYSFTWACAWAEHSKYF